MAVYQINAGWIEGIKHVCSPNYDKRPAGEQITLLVVHNISLPPGCYGGGEVEQLFTNRLPADGHPFFQEIAELKVSAHLFIDRTGRLTQFVSFLDRAWHAGRSRFQGREACNDFSIGIELEGVDDQPYDDRQYTQLAVITRLLMTTYTGITADRIVGHCDIAPDRKSDPGQAFDWAHYKEQI